MIHYYVLGFLDHDAVKRHEFVTRKTLEKTVVQGLAEEMGQVLPNGDISVDGEVLDYHESCLICIAPVVRRKVVDFVVRLARDTGCDIARIDLGHILTPEDFRDLWEFLVDPKNQAPSPWPTT
jgi:hypothetical protein